MFLLAASCAAVACASEPSWEHDFHQEIVNQSTQADVRTKFGEPEMVTPLNNGGSVWTYRYSRGTFKSGYAATSECREYGLTFDKAKVLRSAKELDCSGTLKGYDPTEDEKFLKEPGGR
jgi:hypothetical protein